MHDAIRESIKFDDAVKTKIISFLASNFITVLLALWIPPRIISLHYFSVRIFNSCLLKVHLTFDKPLRFHPLIPNHIFGHMRNNLHFELGLGVRCGESIALVDEETGESMFSIDEDLRKKVLKGFLLQGILQKVSEQFSETCSCSLIWLDIYDTLTHQF